MTIKGYSIRVILPEPVTIGAIDLHKRHDQSRIVGGYLEARSWEAAAREAIDRWHPPAGSLVFAFQGKQPAYEVFNQVLTVPAAE